MEDRPPGRLIDRAFLNVVPQIRGSGMSGSELLFTWSYNGLLVEVPYARKDRSRRICHRRLPAINAVSFADPTRDIKLACRKVAGADADVSLMEVCTCGKVMA